MRKIDSHVHVFPDLAEWLTPRIAKGPLAGVVTEGQVNFFRNQARRWSKPFASALHRLQPAMRMLPNAVREGVDEIASLAPVPRLLVESSPSDLKRAMEKSSLDRAVVVAQPPFTTNELVLELAQEDLRFLAAVNIPPGTPRVAAVLKKYKEAGAKALKIHPAADGEGPKTTRYVNLLKAANELGLPVILHTGIWNTHTFFRKPSAGNPEVFRDWFKNFPNIRFILAHMNLHEPHVAMDLAQEFSNLYLSTSWQPAETIAEAVRRVGDDRVLFASDWPIVGENFKVGLHRIEDCVSGGLITFEQAEKVLGLNAVRVFGIED
jgi:predicted TIM-barrel fold metal-dependent hydrolase